MKKINVRKLIKEMNPNQILTDYMEGTIYLTQKQLQFVIDKKEGRDVGRGSANIGTNLRGNNYEKNRKNKQL